MKINKSSTNHYEWGKKCEGWHLVNNTELSVIKEMMPPSTTEVEHFHKRARQFFYILKGKANFKLENKEIILLAGDGIEVPPNTIHKISNNSNDQVEFLVISQPSTKEDRVEDFENDMERMDLNGRFFIALENSKNGEVNTQTVFRYYQKDQIVWATYEGGDILFGTLSGKRIGNSLIFTYQHQNVNGDFLTGKCRSTITTENGLIHLSEKWQWTCKDFSKGKSLLKEVKI